MSGRLSYYMDVLTVLAEKDFKIRYRNSVLGFVWSLLNPLAYMVILTLVFSFLLHVNIPNFGAWVLIGILIWRFFSLGTVQGLLSFSANPSLVSKLYMPRYLIVLSNNLANFLSAALEFIVLIPLLMVLGIRLSLLAFFLPLILLSEFLLVFGLSLALSSVNQKYQDFRQVWDIVLQLGFFLSPIVYDQGLVPERFQLVYSLNPVTRLIQSTRDVFLMQRLPSLADNLIILSSVTVFLLIGFIMFRRFESRFAEEL